MAFLKAKDGLVLEGGGKALSVIAGEARPLVAFAIYSEDDYSLVFYGTEGSLPTIGDRFNDKTVTDIYTGFDNDVYSSGPSVPWYSVRSNILTVSFDISFAEVQPASTAFWFCYFENCTEIKLDYLNTGLVQSMSYMFYNCTSLTSLDVSDFDTSNVTNMNYMFYYCRNIASLDVSKFDTSNVTSMDSMFYRCSGLTSLDVAEFETSNVTDMSYMFYRCSGLTSLDVAEFDTSNVTNMMSMFGYCENLITIYSANNKFNIEKVISSSNMFSNCSNLVGGNGTTYDSSKVDASMAHVDTASSPGYFTAK